MPDRSFLAIGECMVELAPATDGLFRMGFAGDTFNCAWYARRLLPADWSVGYATAVGSDAVSDDMLAFMAAEGVETGAIRRIEGRTVGLYMIALKDGERSFSYWRGQAAAKAMADDPDWLDKVFAGRDLLHVSGITLAILAPEARERLCAALARARAAGARVSFDTNVRPRLWADAAEMRAGLMLGASVADTVLPSFDEEQAAFGDASPEATVARYRAAGATTVVVKNGAAPILLSAEGTEAEIAPEPVARVVDSTAAGDSFAAGFLAAR
ncbi:sugar kinase, partial [Rhodovulum visakhapatnamense]